MSQLNFFDQPADPASNRYGSVHIPATDTEFEASARVRPNSGATRMRVLTFLGAMGGIGATDYQIGQALQILRTSAGKRRKELQDDGYVVDSGTRRKTDTGCNAIVWRITDAGISAARRSA